MPYWTELSPDGIRVQCGMDFGHVQLQVSNEGSDEWRMVKLSVPEGKAPMAVQIGLPACTRIRLRARYGAEDGVFGDWSDPSALIAT